MTTPPPGPPPSEPPIEDYPEDTPPQGFPPPMAHYPDPPAGYHPPLPDPYPGAQPPPGVTPPRRFSVITVLVGPVIFGLLDVIVTLVLLIGGEAVGLSQNLTMILGAILLASIAFGGGAALLRSKNPDIRGIGLGLMIGWALISLVSGGLCTGLNPSVYR